MLGLTQVAILPGMARFFRILGTIVGGIIAAIQFPKVVETPSRLLVLCLASVIVIFFIVAEIFLYFEEKRREQSQAEVNRQLVRSAVSEYVSAKAASVSSALPASTELGMSADDPRIYLEIEKPKDNLLRKTPFVLWNHGKDVAHTVQIQPLKLDRKKVTFTPVEAIPPTQSGESLPTIDRGGTLNEHDIPHWLLQDWNSNGELIEEWPIQVTVTYSDFSKKKHFVTSAKLVFHAIRYILEEDHGGAWPGHDRVLWEFRDIEIKRVS